MSELKPCPFCGGMAKVSEVTEREYNTWVSRLFIRCTKCGARSGNFDNSTVAERAWNRRCEGAELTFTRQFIHEQGLEYALASAWERRCKDGK